MLPRLLLMAALVGCGAEEPAMPEPPPPEIEAPEPELEPELEDEELDETPPSFTTAELDAMERPQLEEACFAGSQAACDRLGH